MKTLLKLFTGICIGVIIMLFICSNSEPEYKLNLIDQETVQIQSNLSNKIYYCHPDSITYTIDIDNL